jgi:hypothetical protein
VELAGGCEVLGEVELGELLVSGGLVLLLGLLVVSGVVLTGGCEVLGDVVLLLGLFTSLCGMLLPALLQSDEIIFTSPLTLSVFELEDEGVVLLDDGVLVLVPALLADPLLVPVTEITWPTWSASFDVSPWSEYVVPDVLSVSV